MVCLSVFRWRRHRFDASPILNDFQFYRYVSPLTAAVHYTLHGPRAIIIDMFVCVCVHHAHRKPNSENKNIARDGR